MDVFLAVDGNSLLFRAFHALPLMEYNGVHTNALHGFLSMLLKAIHEYQPGYCIVAFDEHSPTFRHKIYTDYKAGRKPTPPELIEQFPIMREILESMGIGVLSLPGYEADDILGFVARKCNETQKATALLLTGDRDALQLVDACSSVLFTRKGISETILFTPEKVKEVYGVLPEQITDLKGLMGDSSDNIPGIPSVGEKTAVKLLDAYGTLENVLLHAQEVKGKLGEKLVDFAEQGRFSKQLATIQPNIPIEKDIFSYTLEQMNNAAPLLRKYGLKQMAERLQAESAGTEETHSEEELFPDTFPFEPIRDLESTKAFLRSIGNQKVALHITSSTFTLRTQEKAANFILSCDLLSDGMAADELFRAVSSFWDHWQLIVHDAKEYMHLFDRYHISFPSVFFDTKLAAYLLDPQRKSYALQSLAPEDANGVWRLYLHFSPLIEKEKMQELLKTLEMPLSGVIFEMEKTGFRIDGKILRSYGNQLQEKAEILKQEIYDLTGVQGFNLNSPQQLGNVLFETLGLKHGKKTARGYSTDAETLEKLTEEHPAIEKILDYRQIAKIAGTYVDPLIEKSDPSGRIHTVFDQTGTATGRISSSEPNLQNIPVRTEIGREIRKAFIPREGWKLVDADYSQIELRVLAHMSGDAAMIDAFNQGQDIHQRTASEVYDVPMSEVTSAMRSSAKAVNFGIVYGISEFGLSKNLGISRFEAREFMDRYLNRYPAIKQFMENAVQSGYQNGAAYTLFGRKRDLLELKSGNANIRSFGERVAMNMPVQGTAADIIKKSMVDTYRRLNQENLRARLILQVHDELIVECPPEEVEKVMELLVYCMENAVKLAVPLTVSVESGDSWFETK